MKDFLKVTPVNDSNFVKEKQIVIFKLIKQLFTFSFSPTISLTEEGDWLLAVESFRAYHSFFEITDENNSFSVFFSDHWEEVEKEAFDTLNRL